MSGWPSGTFADGTTAAERRKPKWTLSCRDCDTVLVSGVDFWKAQADLWEHAVVSHGMVIAPTSKRRKP